MNGRCQTLQQAHRHLQAVRLSHAVLQSVPLCWIQKSRCAGGQPQQSPRGRMELAPGFTGGAGSHAAALLVGALRNLSSSKGSLHCQLTLCSRVSGRTSLHIPAGPQLSKTYAEVHHSPVCQLHMSIIYTGTAPSPNCACGLPLLSLQKHSGLTLPGWPRTLIFRRGAVTPTLTLLRAIRQVGDIRWCASAPGYKAGSVHGGHPQKVQSQFSC